MSTTDGEMVLEGDVDAALAADDELHEVPVACAGNHALRGVLDEATGKWGIRVSRVELKAIDDAYPLAGVLVTEPHADLAQAQAD